MEPHEITESLINLVAMKTLLAEAGMAKALRAKKSGKHPHMVSKETARQNYKAEEAKKILAHHANTAIKKKEQQKLLNKIADIDMDNNEFLDASNTYYHAQLAGDEHVKHSGLAHKAHRKYNAHNANVRGLGGQHKPFK